MDKRTIKHIIFDFGGVLLPIDPQKTIQKFREFGAQDIEHLYSEHAQHGLFDKLECGELSAEAFYDELRNSGVDLTNKKMQEAWNALLLTFPAYKKEDLHQLSKEYSLYLLSNTNKIHYDDYATDFQQQFNEPLRGLFKKAYFSFEVGMRKPHKEIYEYVLRDSQLKPEETLFVDDRAENLEKPKELGMHTYLWNPESEARLTSIFDGIQ